MSELVLLLVSFILLAVFVLCLTPSSIGSLLRFCGDGHAMHFIYSVLILNVSTACCSIEIPMEKFQSHSLENLDVRLLYLLFRFPFLLPTSHYIKIRS